MMSDINKEYREYAAKMQEIEKLKHLRTCVENTEAAFRDLGIDIDNMELQPTGIRHVTPVDQYGNPMPGVRGVKVQCPSFKEVIDVWKEYVNELIGQRI